jgi:hypothetical protein
MFANTTYYTDQAAFLDAAWHIPAQPYSTVATDSFDIDAKAPPHPVLAIQDWSDDQLKFFTNVSGGVLNGCVGQICWGGSLLDVTTTWIFSSPVYAFGGTFWYNPEGEPSNGLVSCFGANPCSGTSLNFPFHDGFFGFVSDKPFTQMTWSASEVAGGFPPQTQNFTLDNLALETSAPEPATDGLIVLGLGGALLPFLRRKRRT